MSFNKSNSYQQEVTESTTIRTTDKIRFTIAETGEQFELCVKVVNGNSTVQISSGFVPLEVASDSVFGGNRIEINIDPM